MNTEDNAKNNRIRNILRRAEGKVLGNEIGYFDKTEEEYLQEFNNEYDYMNNLGTDNNLEEGLK